MGILKTVEGFWFGQCHLIAFVSDEKGGNKSWWDYKMPFLFISLFSLAWWDGLLWF